MVSKDTSQICRIRGVGLAQWRRVRIIDRLVGVIDWLVNLVRILTAVAGLMIKLIVRIVITIEH